jgi:hypothetical protein
MEAKMTHTVFIRPVQAEVLHDLTPHRDLRATLCIELRAGVKLRVNEPPFAQAASK